MPIHTKQSPKCLSDLLLGGLPGREGASAASILRICERELGRQIRSMHDEGLDTGPLRAQKVFVRIEKGHPDFSFPGRSVPRKRPLREMGRLKALADLGLFFRFEFGLTAAARFLGAYFSPDNLGRAEKAGLRKRVVEVFTRALFDQLRRQDKLCTRRNAFFAPISFARCRGWRRSVVQEADLKGLMAHSAEIMENARVLKAGRSSRVAVVEDFPHGPAVLKRMVPRDMRSRLKNMLRPAKALRSWRLANGLVARRIPCALPLAFWSTGPTGYLLTKFVDATPLRVLLRSHLPAWNEAERAGAAEKLAALLARAVRNLHAMGYSHRDLKPSNILVGLKAARPVSVYIMDTDGIRAQYQPLTVAKRARDLGRMAAPLGPLFGKGDCLIRRLVENYLGWSAARADLAFEFSRLVRSSANRYSQRGR